MTAQQIIDFFHLLMDDTSDLSTAEELIVLNKIYKKICIKPYEFLKVEEAGTLSASDTYVALPADFLMIPDNIVDHDSPKKVYVGSDNRIYNVINFADRRSYKDTDGFCYIDFANQRLTFTLQPKAEAYSYDYIYIPADLAIGDTPVIPVCQEVLAYGLATDSYIIQQFPKAQSYANENMAKFNSLLNDIDYYNSNLVNINV